MSESALSPKIEKLLSALVLLLLLCFLIIFGIINLPGFEDLASGDMYEDTLVAKMMWEQKTLFPEGYVFGNQFYVVATPVLAAFIYGLTGSINTSMGLATTLMTFFILISLAWMLRPFVKSRLTILCALLCAVACVFGPSAVLSEEGQLFFTLASFYACYLICALLCFGDYVRAGTDERRRPWALGICMFLCFCTGMQSLRQTCVTVLPILAFELLSAIKRKVKSGAFWPVTQRRQLSRALCYAAANLAGLGFIALLDKPQYTIYNGGSVFSGASISGKFWSSLLACRSVSGGAWIGRDFPLFFTLIFAFFMLVLLGAVIILLFRSKEVNRGISDYWFLTLISLLAVFSASVVSSVNVRSIYLFMYYPLLIFSFVIVMEYLSGKLRYFLVALLCVFSLCNMYYSYHKEIAISLDDTSSPAEQVCDLAMELGYDYVYGCHGYAAPMIAKYSDGALIGGSWEDDIIFRVTPYINIQNIYHLEDYSKAIFVIMPWEKEMCATEIAGNGAQLRLLGVFGEYTVYASSKQLLYPLTWD